LVVLRIYLGWSYVGDRLLSAVVPYEETGWYDGQMWVKPPEVNEHDFRPARYIWVCLDLKFLSEQDFVDHVRA